MNEAAVTAYTFRRHPSSRATSEMNLDVGRPRDVDAVDEPDAVRIVLHDHRAGADAVAEEPNTFHQRAVGHAGGRKDNAVARREILRCVDLPEIGDPHRAAPCLVFRLADDEARE